MSNNEEKLDSPLVVHKVTDASYMEMENSVDVSQTHIEEETATLERHRFKKEKKNTKWPVIITFLVVIVAVACYVYFSGALDKVFNPVETTAPQATESTSSSNRFEGIITVKGTYIFFEGEEVDGIEGLTREIKYLDPGTEFIVQDEDADPTFLGEEILPLLEEYGIKYEEKFIISSGLMSKYETTAPASDTTQAQTEAETAPQ